MFLVTEGRQKETALAQDCHQTLITEKQNECVNEENKIF